MRAADADTDEAPAGKGEFARTDLLLCAEATRAVLRDALLVGCGVDAQNLPHARHAEALHAMARRSDPARIAQAIDLISQFEYRLTFSPSPKIAWTALMVEAAGLLG